MSLNKKVKAVIFDMDGVLIDSEIFYLLDLYQKLSINYPWIKAEDLNPIVGADAKRVKKILCNIVGVSEDNKEFIEEIESMFQSCSVYFPDIMRAEVPSLLTQIRNMGYKTALASSTKLSEIKRMLTQCELNELFDYVISGEMFHESKPNPEIYLHVAEQLKLEPNECLVVEDSAYGISAGISAGMFVVALKDDRFGFDQSKATYLIDKLTEVLEVLEMVEDNSETVIH